MPIINFPEGLSKSQIIRSDLIRLIIAHVNIAIEPKHIHTQSSSVLTQFGKTKSSGAGIDGENIRDQGIDRRNIAENTITSLPLGGTQSDGSSRKQQFLTATENGHHTSPFIFIEEGGTVMLRTSKNAYVSGCHVNVPTVEKDRGHRAAQPAYICSDSEVIPIIPTSEIFDNADQGTDHSFAYGGTRLTGLAQPPPELTVSSSQVEPGDVVMIYCSFNFMVFPLDNDPIKVNIANGGHYLVARIVSEDVETSIGAASTSTFTNQITLQERHFNFIGAANNPAGGYKTLPNSSSCTIVTSYTVGTARTQTQRIQLRCAAFYGLVYPEIQPRSTLVRIDSFNMFYKVIKGAVES